MTLTVTKKDGVTVVTMTSDPQSLWPPVCQLLKTLVYNPLCCGVSQYLKTRSLYVLGTLQVAVALISVGLSVILSLTPGASWWQMDYTGFPFWVGGSLLAFGMFSVVSERFSSPFLVTINAVLQLLGAGFGVAAVVLFSINITTIDLWDFCEPNYYDYNGRGQDPLPTTPSPQQQHMKQSCLEGKRLAMMLMSSINVVLIVLSVMQLCISISSASLVIKALSNKDVKQSADDPEQYKPLLEDVHTA